MITRTNSKVVTFNHPFLLKGIDRLVPAGAYRVLTDEELIECLSFPVYRRLSTMMMVPGQSSSVELVTVDPCDLQAAQNRDTKFAELTSVRAQTADLTLKRNHPGAGALA
jgi:hypothetical protein